MEHLRDGVDVRRPRLPHLGLPQHRGHFLRLHSGLPLPHDFAHLRHVGLRHLPLDGLGRHRRPPPRREAGAGRQRVPLQDEQVGARDPGLPLVPKPGDADVRYRVPALQRHLHRAPLHLQLRLGAEGLLFVRHPSAGFRDVAVGRGYRHGALHLLPPERGGPPVDVALVQLRDRRGRLLLCVLHLLLPADRHERAPPVRILLPVLAPRRPCLDADVRLCVFLRHLPLCHLHLLSHQGGVSSPLRQAAFAEPAATGGQAARARPAREPAPAKPLHYTVNLLAQCSSLLHGSPAGAMRAAAVGRR
mmetsp:Transcript_107268/g.308587  ORF Transcript_107268/g.308587 Transcript_107268/m.308587 type:complete len:303 (-) Transcript_107268:246-1154(-)